VRATVGYLRNPRIPDIAGMPTILHPMERVFSGVQSSGAPHVGNYFGAFRQWVVDQHTADSVFCVVDLHALTVEQDPAQLRSRTLETASWLFASGLDPEICTVFAQSHVHEHTSLSWLLECTATFGELRRMTQFKEKSRGNESVSAGLFAYPVLMAADILLYDTDKVPVGDDQRAHVEFARELARAFNSTFGVVFPEPQELVQEGGRVPGLQADGKMAKSGGSEKGTIFLTESVASALKKVKAAPHAPRGDSGKDFGDPTQCSIFTLHTIVSQPESIQWANVGCRAGTIGCNECKLRMFQHIEPLLEEIQERRAQYAAKGPKFVQELLHENGKVARKRFAQTLAEVQDKMGITPY